MIDREKSIGEFLEGLIVLSERAREELESGKAAEADRSLFLCQDGLKKIKAQISAMDNFCFDSETIKKKISKLKKSLEKNQEILNWQINFSRKIGLMPKEDAMFVNDE